MKEKETKDAVWDRKETEKSIDQAALVSFDLYDTLIFRRHGTPREVFRFMGCLLNQPDF